MSEFVRSTVEHLSDKQLKRMLDFFLYEMDMDQRARLMRTLPADYNAYCGRKVVKVIRESDSLPI